MNDGFLFCVGMTLFVVALIGGIAASDHRARLDEIACIQAGGSVDDHGRCVKKESKHD